MFVTAVREFAADLGFIEGPCHASDMMVISWLEMSSSSSRPRAPLAKTARRRKITAKQLSERNGLLREPGSGTREAVEHALLPHSAAHSFRR